MVNPSIAFVSTTDCDGNPRLPEHGRPRLRLNNRLRKESVWPGIDDIHNQHYGTRREEGGTRCRRIEIQEIPTETGLLMFVKVKTVDQVRFGFIEDFDSHRSFSRILSFALSQSSNWAVPSATRCRR